MTQFIQGFNKTIAVAEEATIGTKATTGWKFLEVNTENMKKTVPKLIAIGLRGGMRAPQRRLPGLIDAGGDLESNIYPDGGLPVFLKAFFGKVTSTQQGTGPAYKHLFEFVDENPYGEVKGLTVQANRDLRVMDYFGNVVESLAFTSESGKGLAGVALNLISIDQDTGSAGSPVFSTQSCFTHWQSTLKVDNVETPVNAWAVNMKNNYKNDYYGASQKRLKIPVNGHREVTGSFTLPVIKIGDLTAIYDKFVAGTKAAFEVTFTGAIIIGAYSYSLKISLPNIFYDGPEAPGSGGLEIPGMECPFTAIATSDTVAEASIEIISEETTI